MKRFAFLLLLPFLLTTPASADWLVTDGAYTKTIRGTTVGGAEVQDINIADGVSGARASVLVGPPNSVYVAFPSPQSVTGSVSLSGTADVSDRAGRLLGVPYGSQAQPIKQTAVNFNSQVEIAVGGTLIDPRAVRALTSSDVVTVANSFLLDNKFPSTAALADGVANPSLSAISVYPQKWNGSTWDRRREFTADYDTGAGTSSVIMYGLALPASGGPVAGGTATNPILIGGDPDDLCTGVTIETTASTNVKQCSTVPAVVKTVSVYNHNGTGYCLDLYDRNTSPTVGTDARKVVLPIPPAPSVGAVGGTVKQYSFAGLKFTNGLFASVKALSGGQCTQAGSNPAATGVYIDIGFHLL